MVRRIDLVKMAAEAHTNLNTWGAIIALLESGLLYGDTSEHRAADRVIKIAKREAQKFLNQYDVARILADRP